MTNMWAVAGERSASGLSSEAVWRSSFSSALARFTGAPQISPACLSAAYSR